MLGSVAVLGLLYFLRGPLRLRDNLAAGEGPVESSVLGFLKREWGYSKQEKPP